MRAFFVQDISCGDPSLTFDAELLFYCVKGSYVVASRKTNWHEFSLGSTLFSGLTYTSILILPCDSAAFILAVVVDPTPAYRCATYSTDATPPSFKVAAEGRLGFTVSSGKFCGNHLFLSSSTDLYVVPDVTLGDSPQALGVGSGVWSCAGDYLAVVQSSKVTIYYLSGSSAVPLTRFSPDIVPVTLRLSPKASRLGITSTSGDVQIFTQTAYPDRCTNNWAGLFCDSCSNSYFTTQCNVTSSPLRLDSATPLTLSAKLRSPAVLSDLLCVAYIIDALIGKVIIVSCNTTSGFQTVGQWGYEPQYGTPLAIVFIPTTQIIVVATPTYFVAHHFLINNETGLLQLASVEVISVPLPSKSSELNICGTVNYTALVDSEPTVGFLQASTDGKLLIAQFIYLAEYYVVHFVNVQLSKVLLTRVLEPLAEGPAQQIFVSPALSFIGIVTASCSSRPGRLTAWNVIWRDQEVSLVRWCASDPIGLTSMTAGSMSDDGIIIVVGDSSSTRIVDCSYSASDGQLGITALELSTVIYDAIALQEEVIVLTATSNLIALRPTAGQTYTAAAKWQISSLNTGSASSTDSLLAVTDLSTLRQLYVVEQGAAYGFTGVTTSSAVPTCRCPPGWWGTNCKSACKCPGLAAGSFVCDCLTGVSCACAANFDPTSSCSTCLANWAGSKCETFSTSTNLSQEFAVLNLGPFQIESGQFWQFSGSFPSNYGGTVLVQENTWPSDGSSLCSSSSCNGLASDTAVNLFVSVRAFAIYSSPPGTLTVSGTILKACSIFNSGSDCVACAAGYGGVGCAKECIAATTCSGHGRCQRTTHSSPCACFSSSSDGYWAGASCNNCATGYYGATCTTKTEGEFPGEGLAPGPITVLDTSGSVPSELSFAAARTVLVQYVSTTDSQGSEALEFVAEGTRLYALKTYPMLTKQSLLALGGIAVAMQVQSQCLHVLISVSNTAFSTLPFLASYALPSITSLGQVPISPSSYIVPAAPAALFAGQSYLYATHSTTNDIVILQTSPGSVASVFSSVPVTYNAIIEPFPAVGLLLVAGVSSLSTGSSLSIGWRTELLGEVSMGNVLTYGLALSYSFQICSRTDFCFPRAMARYGASILLLALETAHIERRAAFVTLDITTGVSKLLWAEINDKYVNKIVLDPVVRNPRLVYTVLGSALQTPSKVVELELDTSDHSLTIGRVLSLGYGARTYNDCRSELVTCDSTGRSALLTLDLPALPANLVLDPVQRQLHVPALVDGLRVYSAQLMRINSIEPNVIDPQGRTTVTVSGEGFVSSQSTARKIRSLAAETDAWCQFQGTVVNATIKDSTTLVCAAPMVSLGERASVEIALLDSNLPSMGGWRVPTDEASLSSVEPEQTRVNSSTSLTVIGSYLTGATADSIFCEFSHYPGSLIRATNATTTSVVCEVPVTEKPHNGVTVRVAMDGSHLSSSSVAFNIVGSPAGIVSNVTKSTLTSSYIVTLPVIGISVVDERNMSVGQYDSVARTVTLSLEYEQSNGSSIALATSRTVNGQAYFKDVYFLSPTEGKYVAQIAVSPNLAQQARVDVVIEPGAPALLYLVPPGEAIYSFSFTASLPVVEIRTLDVAGNLAPPTSDLVLVAYSSPPARSLGSQTVSAQGVAQFRDLIIPGVYGVEYTLQFKCTQLNATVSLPKKLSPEPCSPSTSYYAYAGTQECVSCPTGATCDGTTAIKAQAGYWRPWWALTSRTDANQVPFFKCPNSKLCPGGYATSTGASPCGTGTDTTVPLCGSCLPKHSRTTAGCTPCKSAAIGILVLIALAIVVLIIVSWLVYSSLNAGRSPVLSVLIKIAINHFQVSALVGDMATRWPDVLSNFFSVQRTISEVNVQNVASLRCTWGDLKYNHALIIYEGVPMLVFLIFTLGLVGQTLRLWFRQRGSLLTCLKQNSRAFLTAVIVVLFLVYPTVLKQAASFIPCTDVEGRRFLTVDLRIECTTPSYKAYKVFALVSGFVYGLGIPFGTMFLAYRLNRNWASHGVPAEESPLARRQPAHRHADATVTVIQDSCTATSNDSRDEQKPGGAPQIVTHYFEFLVRGYQAKWWFWDAVILVRKMSFVFTIVFLSDYSQLQMYVIFWILTLFAALHLNIKPFRLPLLNRVEGLSLLILWADVSIGLLYHYDESPQAALNVATAMIFITNVTMFLVLFVCVLREIKKVAARRLGMREDENWRAVSFAALKAAHKATRVVPATTVIHPMSNEAVESVEEEMEEAKPTSPLRRVCSPATVSSSSLANSGL
eukprot:TRINITY_DN6010_c0_g1_i5.p1 TRINITY_DN6010_c0_g1~~TRINITY_DN6010_c0_g1_i5.p1  ORF type:complete len:2482 (+),score=255.21 TRINITY_DN6010_c0_g1_i5:691-7446(+)